MRKTLIQKRKEIKLTQKNLATKIGVSRSSIAAYEIGTISPSLNVCLKIKNELNYFDDNLFENLDE